MVDFTIEEACRVLDPPMTPRQLLALVRTIGIQPTGSRRTGYPGRPKDTYDSADLLRLHAVLAPFLDIDRA